MIHNKLTPHKPLTIGIPKGMFYHQHGEFWREFILNLGFNVVVSQDTNKNILNLGLKHCTPEACLPVKVFHGHVASLMDLSDYILIPRYVSMNKHKLTCPKFCALPDMTQLNFKNKVNLIEVKLQLSQSVTPTYNSLLTLSKILSLEFSTVLSSFNKALKSYSNSQALQKIQKLQLGRLCVAVLGHSYMIHDEYISMRLIKKLTDRNIFVLTPAHLGNETKVNNAFPYHNKVFWDSGIENLGSAFSYSKRREVNGMIYLTPFACGLDALIIEFIERRLKSIKALPFLKLSLDEHTGESGFDTRLEAFLDILMLSNSKVSEGECGEN